MTGVKGKMNEEEQMAAVEKVVQAFTAKVDEALDPIRRQLDSLDRIAAMLQEFIGCGKTHPPGPERGSSDEAEQ
jgi:hypothetical protein